MKMTAKFKWTSSWFLCIHIALHLLLIFVQGNEETDDAFANGKHFVLEYFLPVNLPHSSQAHVKGKREVEGSGDETNFGDIDDKNEDKEWQKTSNSSESAIEKIMGEHKIKLVNNEKNFEGSGEIDYISEKDKGHTNLPPILEDSEINSSTFRINYSIKPSSREGATEMTASEEYSEAVNKNEVNDGTTESIKKSDSDSDSESESTEISVENSSTKNSMEIISTEEPITANIPVNIIKFATVISTTQAEYNEQTTEPATKSEESSVQKNIVLQEHNEKTYAEKATTIIPTVKISEISLLESESPEDSTTIGLVKVDIPKFFSTKNISIPPPFFHLPTSTVGKNSFEPLTTIKTPVEEEVIFKETKISQETMAAPPGNILQKKNMTLGVDPLLIITNTRLIDSDDVDIDKNDSRRLGAYIVIGLILLSFFSLVGYFIFKRKQYRKKQDFDSNPESQDTEKALLSLTDYKDNSELEENHLKNNEITPIVVKSNSQINKFEKNTNFSSPKNLNTIANEKNIEKDNVLKSTTENLTQVIIEDSPKEVEEDKNAPCMEKLIVKTRLDPDSIPKKPIIVNRTSAGYIPIPKDIV